MPVLFRLCPYCFHPLQREHMTFLGLSHQSESGPTIDDNLDFSYSIFWLNINGRLQYQLGKIIKPQRYSSDHVQKWFPADPAPQAAIQSGSAVHPGQYCFIDDQGRIYPDLICPSCHNQLQTADYDQKMTHISLIGNYQYLMPALIQDLQTMADEQGWPADKFEPASLFTYLPVLKVYLQHWPASVRLAFGTARQLKHRQAFNAALMGRVLACSDGLILYLAANQNGFSEYQRSDAVCYLDSLIEHKLNATGKCRQPALVIIEEQPDTPEVLLILQHWFAVMDLIILRVDTDRQTMRANIGDILSWIAKITGGNGNDRSKRL